MRLIITVLLTLFPCLLKSQTYSGAIKDELIAGFIKQLNHDAKLHVHKIRPEVTAWQLKDFCFDDPARDSVYEPCGLHHFSKQDMSYVVTQYDSIRYRNLTWRKRDFKGFVFIDSIGEERVFGNSTNRHKGMRLLHKRIVIGNYFYAFSVPFFSRDGKMAVIKRGYYCGSLCATECTALYKLSPTGKWILVDAWDCLSS